MRDIHDFLMERLAHLTGARMCFVCPSAPEQRGIYIQIPGYGMNGNLAEALQKPVATLFSTWDFRDRGIFRVNTRDEVSVIFKPTVSTFETTSILAAPVYVENCIRGMLLTLNKPEGFSEEDAQLLEVFAA